MLKINSLIITKKNYKEKISTFECGFDPKREARLPFSIHFFLIAVIFLIFDVEITIILPIPLILTLINKNLWIIINTFFLVVLTAGTIHEWKEGALQWAKLKESFNAFSFDLKDWGVPLLLGNNLNKILDLLLRITNSLPLEKTNYLVSYC